MTLRAALRRLVAHAIGYAIAWALVLGLAMAGCRAVWDSVPAAPHDQVAPSVAPAPMFSDAPEVPAPIVPAWTVPPDTEPVPEPVYDCSELDDRPDDLDFDPESQCEHISAGPAPAERI